MTETTMACDVSLLDGLFDDLEEEEEDWTSTDWADPVHSSARHSNCRTNAQASVPDAESSCSHMQTGQSTEKQKGDGTVVQRMLLNDNKAGMEGLDKERINQIIHEASKGSKFYENERQKEEQMKRRIEEQRQKIQHISAEQLRQGTVEADRLLEDFEQQRDLSRTIVHIDMDAFYAAVEIRDDPSLKNKPMAVGGNSMLSTSNYHARKFGVRAAMPGFIARKLCPELVIVPLNFEKYTAVSKQVKGIMSNYDPNFCPMSLDEAYLDLTEHLQNRQAMSVDERTFICRDAKYTDSRAHCKCELNEIARNYGNQTVLQDGSVLSDFFSKAQYVEVMPDKCGSLDGKVSEENKDNRVGVVTCPVCKKELPPFKHVTFGLSDEDAVSELRTRIEQKTTLTASAGIAPNMMLAKVCSDKNKPNGQYKIKSTCEDVMNFIRDLPTRKISGIGKVSEAMLNAVGVHTCTHLYERRGLLYHLYSQISFNYFMRICLGIGSTTVERDSERKSMSTERTFSELSKPADLYQRCEELSASLAEDLKSEQLKGKTVSIKIKTVKFEVRTRAHTVRDYTSDYDDIVRSATDLLRTEIQNCAPQPLRLRLMGVRMSNLLHESLCQGKKQNTIIGAFKRLANVSPKKKPNSEASDVDINHVDIAAAKVLGTSAQMERSKIDVSETEKEAINSNQTMEWKSASEVLDDNCTVKNNVTVKNMLSNDIPAATSLAEPDTELVNSGSPANSSKFLDHNVEETPEIAERVNTDSESYLKISEKPCLKHEDVSKVYFRGRDDYKKMIDVEDDKDTCNKDSDISCISQIKVTEIEVNVVPGNSVSEKEVNVFLEKNASEKEVDIVPGNDESEEEVNLVSGSSVSQKEVNVLRSSASEKEVNFSRSSASEKEVNVTRSNATEKEPNFTESSASEKEVNVTGSNASEKEANFTESSASEKEVNVKGSSASDRQVNTVTESSTAHRKNNSSVFSPSLRTTRRGLIRTPVSQSKRKNKRNRNKDKTDLAVTYTCPVCALNILCENLQTFNEHVDICLESGEHGSQININTNNSSVEDKRNLGVEKDDFSNSTGGIIDKMEGTTQTSLKIDNVHSGTAVTRKTHLNHTENCEDDHASIEIHVNKVNSTEESCTENDKKSSQLNEKDTEYGYTECSVDNCALHEDESQSTLKINETNEDGFKKSKYVNKCDKNSAKSVCKIDIKENADMETECSVKEFDELDVEDTSNNDMNVKGETEIVPMVQPSVKLLKRMVLKDNEFKQDESCDSTDSEIGVEDKEGKTCPKVCESEMMHSVATSKDIEIRCKTIPNVQPGLLECINTEISDNEVPSECKEVSLPSFPLSPDIIIQNGNGNLTDDISYQKQCWNNEDRTFSIKGKSEMDLTDHRSIESEYLQTSQVRKNAVEFPDEIEELNEENASSDTQDDVGSEPDGGGGLLVCPVCNVEQRSADLNDFNSHVDSCLSRGTITQILKEQKKQENGGIKRSRPSTPGSSKSVKRRKTTMPSSSKPCRSIASFFMEK